MFSIAKSSFNHRYAAGFDCPVGRLCEVPSLASETWWCSHGKISWNIGTSFWDISTTTERYRKMCCFKVVPWYHQYTVSLGTSRCTTFWDLFGGCYILTNMWECFRRHSCRSSSLQLCGCSTFKHFRLIWTFLKWGVYPLSAINHL